VDGNGTVVGISIEASSKLFELKRIVYRANDLRQNIKSSKVRAEVYLYGKETTITSKDK
jgi:hypothetical protein